MKTLSRRDEAFLSKLRHASHFLTDWKQTTFVEIYKETGLAQDYINIMVKKGIIAQNKISCKKHQYKWDSPEPTMYMVNAIREEFKKKKPKILHEINEVKYFNVKVLNELNEAFYCILKNENESATTIISRSHQPKEYELIRVAYRQNMLHCIKLPGVIKTIQLGKYTPKEE